MADERVTVNIRARSSDFKLAFLRIQLFTALQMLQGEDLEKFWQLIDEVNQCRPVQERTDEQT
jgi:hypothetical protein